MTSHAQSEGTGCIPARARMARAVGIQRGARGVSLARRAPRGDGHAVVVFPPGRLGRQHASFARIPAERGYEAPRLATAFQPRAARGVFERSVERVQLARSTGRKVSLIGWSLGGVYAREIAKVASEDVRCVITLGTPFTGNPRANNAWRITSSSGHGLDDPDQWRRIREHRRFRRLPCSAAAMASWRGSAACRRACLSPRASRSPRATSAWE